MSHPKRHQEMKVLKIFPSKTPIPPPIRILQDPKIPGARYFRLKELLTPEECRYYIEETEKMGYQSVDWEYDKEVSL